MYEFLAFLKSLLTADYVTVPVQRPYNVDGTSQGQPRGDWPEGDNIAWTDNGFRRNNGPS